jgi:DNA (cytosine-5)-methyltransferase 1
VNQHGNNTDGDNSTHEKWRAIEFFAGIGGFATAWPKGNIVAAFDINQRAAEVYQANHPHPYKIREIETISLDELTQLAGNFWWMSPPCQPYTTRGKQRDIEDHRSRSLLRLIELIPHCVPDCIVLENVVGFVGSKAQLLLIEQLSRCGYRVQDVQLCPTELHWPNRRKRYYLIASMRHHPHPWKPKPVNQIALHEILEKQIKDDTNELLIAHDAFAKIVGGTDRVSPESSKPTACFASSYGRSLVRSGSYLEQRDGSYRRFTPREVASLMGYPPTFKLPGHLGNRELWKLLGNSLSIPAVKYVLSHLQ